MRSNRLLLLGALAALVLGAGCSYAKVTRGDLATKGVVNDAPPLSLVVSVAAFRNEAGADADDAQFALSKSYLTALDETRLFKSVYTEVEAPDSDVKFEGTLREVSIYQNNWWIGLWAVTGAATFGIFPGVGALLGLPYQTDNGTIEFEVRAVERRTGEVVATYVVDWTDTMVYNVYNSSENKQRSIYDKPKFAMQLACDKAMKELVADRAKFAAIAMRRASDAPPPAEGQAGRAAGPTGPTGPIAPVSGTK